MEGLNKILSRLPILPLIALYCGWLAYSYHDWLNAPESDLGLKKISVQNAKRELEVTKKKLAQGEEFFKNLDAIRTRIRQLTAQLDSTKTVLSADIDIANFVRMVTLEAKKLGITIKSISPGIDVKREYYIEVPFNVSLKGAYIQILVFFDRIARFQQVVKVGDFDLHPSGNAFTKYVELQGTTRIVAYKYLGTHVDTVLDKAEMKGGERGDGK